MSQMWNWNGNVSHWLPQKRSMCPADAASLSSQMMKLCLLNVVNGGSKKIRGRQNFTVLSCVYGKVYWLSMYASCLIPFFRILKCICAFLVWFPMAVFNRKTTSPLDAVFFTVRDGNLLLSNMSCCLFLILYLCISLPFGQRGGYIFCSGLRGYKHCGWKPRRVIGSGSGRNPHYVEFWLDGNAEVGRKCLTQ